MPIRIKRAYEEPDASDGTRILVDHLWPRGVKKDDLKIDRWMREVSPSTALRKWYQHEPGKWEEFRKRFEEELAPRSQGVQELANMAQEGTVTLVFAAKDAEHSNARVLKEYVERRLSEGGRSRLREGA
jgi:uncharacterized protein YeaO (DUF488 family)